MSLHDLLRQLRLSATVLLATTAITGVAYPMAMTGLLRTLFPRQAEGSMIVRHGVVVGSSLIGQPFDDPRYFWSRPSATGPFADNAASSTGSNLGPLNPALLDAVKGRVAALRAADPGHRDAVPMDLVTASASGLDPHLTVEAVRYQAGRVARSRRLDRAKVDALIAARVEPATWGVLGTPRVNVLLLNLDLDALTGH